MVWYEARICRERVNARISTDAIMLHAAYVAVKAPKGAGVKNFDKLLKDLRDGN